MPADQVTDELASSYIALARRNPPMATGWHGLLQAGACRCTNKQIRDACSHITKLGLANPLGKHEEATKKANLQKVFQYAVDNGMDFLKTGNPVEIAEQL